MNIAQRYASSTSHPAYGADRWRFGFGNHSAGTVTASQQSLSSSDTPYTLGFRKHIRIALGQAGTAASNTYINLRHKIEAQDIAQCGWNYTSSSSFITLQFWFRCSTNQTFYAELKSDDGTSQSFVFSFTASGNNTWTKITKTIPGNSNIQFDNDNGSGLGLWIYAYFGSGYTNNKTLDTWAPFDSSNYMPTMATTWLTAGASTWDVTGFQLEVGDTATSFEHRSHAEELRRCKRYYQTAAYTTLMGSASGAVSTPRILFEVEMRAVPTSVTTEYSSNGNGSFRNQNDGSIITGHTTFNYYINGFDFRGSSGSSNIIYSSTYVAEAEI